VPLPAASSFSPHPPTPLLSAAAPPLVCPSARLSPLPVVRPIEPLTAGRQKWGRSDDDRADSAAHDAHGCDCALSLTWDGCGCGRSNCPVPLSVWSLRPFPRGPTPPAAADEGSSTAAVAVTAPPCELIEVTVRHRTSHTERRIDVWPWRCGCLPVPLDRSDGSTLGVRHSTTAPQRRPAAAGPRVGVASLHSVDGVAVARDATVAVPLSAVARPSAACYRRRSTG
jgi:hypothetical protein